MAVSFVQAYSTDDDAPADGVLDVVNVDGGAGNFLIIIATWRDSPVNTISSVTYGGSATGITAIETKVANGGGATAAYYLIAPAGTETVSVTWASTPANMQVTVLVFSGVHQSAPLGTHATGTGNTTLTSTAAVTSTADGMVVDGIGVRGSPGTITADGGQTERSTQAASGSMHHRTSTEPGAASVAMGWSWTNGTSYTHIVVPLEPAEDASEPFKSMLSTPARGIAPTPQMPFPNTASLLTTPPPFFIQIGAKQVH